MTTVFGNEGNNFYSAFFEPDSTQRRAALDAWVESATPAIQAAVSEELKAFVEFVTEGRWTEEGWKLGEEKLRRIQNDYHLIMDIKVRKLGLREAFKGELPTPVIQKSTPLDVQAAQHNSKLQETPNRDSEDDDTGDDNDGGRTPNDDRSDSMNPNNEAYWSSRGH